MARTAHNKIDLTGRRYGQLEVIEEAERGTRGLRWLCRCDCGKQHTVNGGDLRSGHTTTCGCGRFSNPRNFKHGKTSSHGKRSLSKAYIVWFQMKQRCGNPNVVQYKDYGGRGIGYDPRWEDFSAFLEDMGEPPTGKFLDRRDNDGNYCKENCRWVTRLQNNRNARSNVIVEHNGLRLMISEWAERLGVNYFTLYTRIVTRKWPLEKALSPCRYDKRGQATK